jgi:hypothetical protein
VRANAVKAGSPDVLVGDRRVLRVVRKDRLTLSMEP